MLKSFKILLFILLAVATASAGTLSGTVTNGTNGKPATGDDVILLSLQGGMQEEARTKTDSQGHFSLNVADDSIPHLVRAVHDNVWYHQPAPPGTSTANVQVFDAARKVDGLTGSFDVMRIQTDGTGLSVTESYVLKNNSSPQRTVMSERTFEVYLPKAAAVDQAQAAGPGGMPVRTSPIPLPDKGHYAFNFPLRPGETSFQLSYHLPYSGSADFSPRLTLPMENLGIMLPKSMRFTPAKLGSYEGLNDNGTPVQVLRNVAAGAVPAFRVSGTGTIPAESQDQNAGDTGAGGGSASNRPGGGLGNPEATPDPLQNYRWYILGLLVLVLAAGAFWATNRREPTTTHASGATTAGAPPFAPSGSDVLNYAEARKVGNRGNMLLEALKEELFQLETERLQKKISEDEYARAKAALDETLGRAMRRNG
ncbi:MAG TPA: carboxypeptidase regulatory-like domain-containing protein [Terriglobales bacterium]|nr:carboxypeptidase regulatory-like domain-containing protein [Terriglobales bacterium]